MTPSPTVQIINRHMARLLTDIEALGCSAEVKNTVRTEMRWLRNDLTKDAPDDFADAVRFYRRNVCHLPDKPRPIAKALKSLFGCAENRPRK